MPGSAISTTASANRARSPRRRAGAMAGATSSSMADLRKAPLAVEAVRRIDEIFAIEREINGQPAGHRLAVRQEATVKPLVADLEKWMRAERARLSRHADDRQGDRLHAERAGRPSPASSTTAASASATTPPSAPCAVLPSGRRSWLFAGSDRGGERAAAMYTLIATAKLNDIDPQAWLADVLAPHRRSPRLPPARTPALALEGDPRASRRRLSAGPLRSSAEAYAPPPGRGGIRSYWPDRRAHGWHCRRPILERRLRRRSVVRYATSCGTTRLDAATAHPSW